MHHILVKKSRRNMQRELRWGLHIDGNHRAAVSFLTWERAMEQVAKIHRKWPGRFGGSRRV
jgi:hypothetical protein